ncbi:hypothetical protein [Paenibacillus rhizolycopersici]|uniref:hypothetical protein n=1 Tax=Paenibacillus rhizolycopersici TaxID=2780073 RepID=UPI003D28A3D5
MSFKMDGFDELEKRLKKMKKDAEELEGDNVVPFDELFTPAFMRKYTSVESFDELLEKGGFVVNSQEDFANIPDDKFDEHVSKFTNFSTWEDMLDKAQDLYISKKLGL